MQEAPPAPNPIRALRRRLSITFWSLWKSLPLSEDTRQHVMDVIFRRLPIFVSWSATYRNWQAEARRRAAQLARLEEFRKAAAEAGEGSARYADLSALPRPDRLTARAIAFYLPQFHPIPENDAWWGEGFTEWTNVRRARPQYEGHRQPRRPAELGYYDLVANPAIRRRQAALAHQYGLEGFCFYFYWFGGKRLLEDPIRAWADDDAVTLPFCLCWANENWSRRWDGREDQTLISQSHSPTDDTAFIEHVAGYMRSGKYIRVKGRPLLIVYRPDLLPDAGATAARWRTWCRENGIGEIYLAHTLSFASDTPDEYGFDAAIEFPPNNMGLVPQTKLVEPVGEATTANICDLTELAAASKAYPRPSCRLFRGVTPQWDNTARRMDQATIMLDGGPSAYEQWLRNAAADMTRRETHADERLVFINAWNEWAEGAYLEPDTDRGYAWLAATRRALSATDEPLIEPSDLVPAEPMPIATSRPKIIIVIHDLNHNGAQIHSLHLARVWRDVFGYDVVAIACDDGPLRRNFEAYGRLLILKEDVSGTDQFTASLQKLKAEGFTRAVINSSAAGWISTHLVEAEISCLGLVHELPDIIRAMKLDAGLDALDRHARHVVFASGVKRERTAREILGRPWSRPIIQPQGLYKADSILHPREKAKAAEDLRQRMNLPEDTRFIIGVGFGDRRKGPDIFCRWAIEAAGRDRRLHFIWLGGLSPEMIPVCEAILAEAGDVGAHVHLLGFQAETSAFYRAASAYALTSREDPYPSTILEALACGAPAFIIAGTTGVQDLAASPAIRLLPDADPATFADALAGLLCDEAEWASAAEAGIRLIQQDFGFTSFAGDLLRLSGIFQPRISVVVPNYNYSRHLPHRIATLLNQELPVWEIIFLDDASTDDSVEVAEQLLKDCGIHYRIIRNAENSGSVFAQWQKGVTLARGDIVWIAEADDWASARFTRVAASAFRDPDVVISYTQSNQVSEASEILCPHYLDYIADLGRERWRRPFVNDGMAELNDGFSVKNTIPNVSGALFRREALADVLDRHMEEIRSYRVAGDWCAYAHLARHGKVAFDPRPLNYHRRHEASVTISRFTEAEWNEIARMQARIAELGDVSPGNADKARAYLEALKARL